MTPEAEKAMTTLVKELRESGGGLMKLSAMRGDGSAICTVVVAVDETADHILRVIEAEEARWDAEDAKADAAQGALFDLP